MNTTTDQPVSARQARKARRNAKAFLNLLDNAERPVIRTFLVIDEQGFQTGTVSFVQRVKP